MTYDEIKGYLMYNNKESNLFLANEIFEMLKCGVTKPPHIAFSYTYVYFITWLFRYAKYYNTGILFDNKNIKEILGYSATNQTLDYLIKKGGVLDKLKITQSIKDFPAVWEFDRNNDDEEITFLMYSELEEGSIPNLPSLPKRYFIKKPVMSFHRYSEDSEEYVEEDILDGTFYDVSSTHNISFEVFLFCMSNEELGCTAFYLYSYLKHKNDIFTSGYDVSVNNLAEETNISLRSLCRYMASLKKYKLINCNHNMEFFVVGLPDGLGKANTYITNSHYKFVEEAVTVKKLEVRSLGFYMKHLEEQVELSELIERDMPF